MALSSRHCASVKFELRGRAHGSRGPWAQMAASSGNQCSGSRPAGRGQGEGLPSGWEGSARLSAAPRPAAPAHRRHGPGELTEQSLMASGAGAADPVGLTLGRRGVSGVRPRTGSGRFPWTVPN